MRRMTPGERLRAWRKEHGLSQEEVAERIGVDQAQVSRIEAESAEPRASVAEKLRELTGGHVTWASTGTEG